MRVILLAEATAVEVDESQPSLSIAHVLAESPGQRIFQTAEAVKQYLQEERESWDR